MNQTFETNTEKEPTLITEVPEFIARDMATRAATLLAESQAAQAEYQAEAQAAAEHINATRPAGMPETLPDPNVQPESRELTPATVISKVPNFTYHS